MNKIVILVILFLSSGCSYLNQQAPEPEIEAAKEFTSFSISGMQGIISGKNIGVTLKFGQPRENLVANFTISGSDVKVDGASQVSGVTVNDFSLPRDYLVYASDGSFSKYTVTVVNARSDSKDITQFSINGVSGVITDSTIGISLPYGTSILNLIAEFSFTGVEVKIGSQVQISGVTINSFITNQVYSVYADDGTTKNYTVSVQVRTSDSKDITEFSIMGYSASINGTSIGLVLPAGTYMGALVAIFRTTGKHVKIDDILQVSGYTINNYSENIVYTVFADDGSSKDYLVSVSVDNSSSNDISSFSILGYTGVISGTSIGVTLPHGTNVSSLVASFSTTGKAIFVNGMEQVSGTTVNDFSNPIKYKVFAFNDSFKEYTVVVNVVKDSSKDFLTFSIVGHNAIFSGNHIGVVLPNGTDRRNLVANFTTTGTEVRIGSTKQISGATSNNFMTDVVYTVYAEDGSNKRYTVSVINAPGNSKDIVSFSIYGYSGVISGNNISITLPYGVNKASLIPIFVSTGSRVQIGETIQVSGTTINNFTNDLVYTVYAADDSKKEYTVSIQIALNNSRDITSFSISGVLGIINGTNINLNMPYGTDLSSLVATFITNGKEVKIESILQISGSTLNNFSNTIVYTVYAEDGKMKSYNVIVTANKSSSKDITAFSIMGINASILGTTIGITLPYGTEKNSLSPIFTTSGQLITVDGVSQTSGVTINDFSENKIYKVYAEDGTSKEYLIIVQIAFDTSKEITSFSVLGRNAVISGTNIYVVLPYGSDRSALVASFETTGTSVKIGSISQVSGSTINSFNSSQVYSVYAEDGSFKDYTIVINVALGDSKDIIGFSILGVDAQISGTNIGLTLPYGTDKTSLIASFSFTGVSIKIGSVIQNSNSSINNYTSVVQYSVYAGDGSYKNYYVSVTLAPNSAKSVISFSILGAMGVITDNTIGITVPYGTDLSSLVATFVSTGVSVKIGNVPQVSGVTANNCTSNIIYTVWAEDGTSKNYTIMVQLAAEDSKEITSFSLQGYIGIISGNNIDVNIPSSVNLNAITAEFSTTGIGVMVGNVAQVSGITINNFSSQVVYTVYANNGTYVYYYVNIHISLRTEKTIEYFAIMGNTASIIGNNIILTLPYGTDRSSLVASYITTGIVVKIGGIIQTSGITSNNYTNTVIYRVYAEDGTRNDYSVIVNNVKNNSKDIDSFSVLGYQGYIYGSNIRVAIPNGTDKSALTAVFGTTGDLVKIGLVEQISGSSQNDYSGNVIYTVYAEDGSSKEYTVIVEDPYTLFVYGSEDDECGGIVFDTVGNLYVSGYTKGSLYGQTNIGEYDTFVAKYDASGNQKWIRYIASEQNDESLSLAIDENDNIYVSGYTYGDLDGEINNGGSDVFLVKFTQDGTKKWTRLFGNEYDDEATSTVTDINGNIYITGMTYESINGEVFLGESDIFLIKILSNGDTDWVRLCGSENEDGGLGLVTYANSIYVSGYTYGIPYGENNNGNSDILVVKYDSDGNRLWLKLWGTVNFDCSYSITADSNENIYLTGFYNAEYNLEGELSNSELFLLKANSNGNGGFVKTILPEDQESIVNGYSIVCDENDYIYISGCSSSPIDGVANNGELDLLVAKYDDNGNNLWVRLIGADSSEEGSTISYNNGYLYVGGITKGYFDGKASTTYGDVIITRFNTDGVR